MRPEDNQDFMGLYRERAELERERKDLIEEDEFNNDLLRKNIGSQRQQEAWARHGEYTRYRVQRINDRLAEIEKHNRPMKKG